MIIIDNVNNDNLQKALKTLKKKWQDSKTVEQLRDRKYFTNTTTIEPKEQEFNISAQNTIIRPTIGLSRSFIPNKTEQSPKNKGRS